MQVTENYKAIFWGVGTSVLGTLQCFFDFVIATHGQTLGC